MTRNADGIWIVDGTDWSSPSIYDQGRIVAADQGPLIWDPNLKRYVRLNGNVMTHVFGEGSGRIAAQEVAKQWVYFAAGEGVGYLVGRVYGAYVLWRVSVAEGKVVATMAPGGGLAAHEAQGGHLLAKHVGKTEEELFRRALTDPMTDTASSFFDQATAEAVAAQAIDKNAAKIGTWIASGARTPLPIETTMSSSVGRIVTSEGVAVTSSTARIVIVRDASSPIGFYIKTGYPVPK
jgi:hypothetical protein